MKILIARHGEASFNAPSDHERALTPRGETLTKALVSAHIDSLQQVDLIWCSHLTRAIQTANIYSDALSIKPIKQTFLSPDSRPEKVIKALSQLESDQTILLVSHQPLVGDLVSLFCQGDLYRPHPFVTSEVVVLEMDYPAAGLATQVANFLPI